VLTVTGELSVVAGGIFLSTLSFCCIRPVFASILINFSYCLNVVYSYKIVCAYKMVGIAIVEVKIKRFSVILALYL